MQLSAFDFSKLLLCFKSRLLNSSFALDMRNTRVHKFIGEVSQRNNMSGCVSMLEGRQIMRVGCWKNYFKMTIKDHKQRKKKAVHQVLIQKNLKNTWDLKSYSQQSWDDKKGFLGLLWKKAYYEIIFGKAYTSVSFLLN